MRYALISSVYDLDLVEEFNYHLLLAWAFENEVYRTFYKNLIASRPDDFFILDNGANEKKMMEAKELVSLAIDLGVNEVQAPDIYLESNETIRKAKTFLKSDYQALKEHGIGIMGIPQGRNFKAFKSCWDYMLECPEITTIGLGYRNVLPAVEDDIAESVTHDWKDMGVWDASELIDFVEPQTFKYTMSRLLFLKRKVNLIDLTIHKKRLHLLGLWQPVELKYYNSVFSPEELKLIRGCDSAAPIQAAQVYVEFDKQLGVKSKPKEYLDMFSPLGRGQRIIADRNIQAILEWIK